MNKKLVYGVGINDAGYVVRVMGYIEERLANGNKKQVSVWFCPYYARWGNMLKRCYSKKHHNKRPTYQDCSVSEEWLLFSNFREWMVTQEWEGNELDKDLLLLGNKVYSPETCVFVNSRVNSFILDSGVTRVRYLIGCYWNKSKRKFKSQCRNIFTKKSAHLGYFNTEIEAHLAWKKRKHELACELADSEYVTDERVAIALRTKYKNYTILEDHIK